MQPVNFCDELTFERSGNGIQLSCSDKKLPVNSKNLIFRAAENFLSAAKISDGVAIDLWKKIPLAAGLGGGSGNAATTLLALNELFEKPLSEEKLNEIATSLGSDIPFFFAEQARAGDGARRKNPAARKFSRARRQGVLLIHPGFGISTPWAYQNLARFPEALNGKAGRAKELAEKLQTKNLAGAAGTFYNSLEAPALENFQFSNCSKNFCGRTARWLRSCPAAVQRHLPSRKTSSPPNRSRKNSDRGSEKIAGWQLLPRRTGVAPVSDFAF